MQNFHSLRCGTCIACDGYEEICKGVGKVLHCLECGVDGLSAKQCNNLRASLISAFTNVTTRPRAAQLCSPANITPHMWTEAEKVAAKKVFKIRETENTLGKPVEFSEEKIVEQWEKLAEPLTAQRHQRDEDDDQYLVLRGWTEQAAAAVIAKKIGCCISTAILSRPEHVKGSSYQLKPCRLCDRRIQLLCKLNRVYDLDYKFHINQPRKYTCVNFVSKDRRRMRRRTRLRKAEKLAYEKDHKELEILDWHYLTRVWQRRHWRDLEDGLLNPHEIIIEFDYMKKIDLEKYIYHKGSKLPSCVPILCVLVRRKKEGKVETKYFLAVCSEEGTSAYATRSRLEEIFKRRDFKNFIGKARKVIVGCDCAQDNRTGEMCDFFLSRVPELLKHICVVEFNPKIQSHGIGDYDRIFSHVTFWLTINNAKIFLTDVNEVELALIRSIDGIKNRRNYTVLLSKPITAPPKFRPYFNYVGVRQTHSLKAVYRKRYDSFGGFRKVFSCVIDQGLAWLPHKPVNKVIIAKTWDQFFIQNELNTMSSLVGKKLPTRASTLRRKKKVQLDKINGGPGLLITHKKFKSIWNRMQRRRR